MSYDMDIWNDEKDYFSESIEISLFNTTGPFYSLQKYLNREPEIIQIVENFVTKNLNNQEMQKKKQSQTNNQRNKKQTPKPQANAKSDEKADLNQEFPSLTTTQKQESLEQPQLVKKAELLKEEGRNPDQDIDNFQEKKEFKAISFAVDPSQDS